MDSSFASNRYLYLLYTYDAKTSASRSAEVVAAHARHGERRQHGVGRDGAARQAPDAAVPGAREQRGLHPVGQHRALDRYRPLGRRRHAVGRLGRRLQLRRSRPEGACARTTSRALSGKIIHVDRNGNGLPGHPFCPGVTDLTQVCTKVFAKGFRNPFRFTIRPNGLPAVGDVGWGSWEELNLAQPGAQLRLALLRGQVEARRLLEHGHLQGPLYEGGHAGGRHVPRPPLRATARARRSSAARPTRAAPYPDEFDGDIIFGDYVQGFIKRLELDGSGKPTGTKDFVTGLVRRRHRAVERRALLRRLRRRRQGSGSVVRIAYSPNNSTPIAVATATPTFGAAPLKVTFKGSGSSDPDGDPLKYEWDFGDGTTKSTAKDPPVHTYTKGGNFDARLKVTDSKNASATATVRISVNNSPPVVTLDRARSTARSTATACRCSSRARRPIPTTARSPTRGCRGTSCSCTATTCIRSRRVTGKTGSFTPTHRPRRRLLLPRDADRDRLGRPEHVQDRRDPARDGEPLDREHAGAGAPINYAGYSLVAAPHRAQAAIGFRTSVSAAQRFVANGRAYEFTGWSDGGAIAHDITIPATDLALVARYRDAGPGGCSRSAASGPGRTSSGRASRFAAPRARRLAGNGQRPERRDAARRGPALAQARRRCRWWSAKRGRLSRKRTRVHEAALDEGQAEADRRRRRGTGPCRAEAAGCRRAATRSPSAASTARATSRPRSRRARRPCASAASPRPVE